MGRNGKSKMANGQLSPIASRQGGGTHPPPLFLPSTRQEHRKMGIFLRFIRQKSVKNPSAIRQPRMDANEREGEWEGKRRKVTGGRWSVAGPGQERGKKFAHAGGGNRVLHVTFSSAAAIRGNRFRS